MSDLTIVVDTREQTPWDFSEFNVDTVVDTLETGDYSIPGYEDTFAIERKSLDDLCRSVGVEHERFRDEVIRAHEGLKHFKIIIEDNRYTIYDYVGKGESPHTFSQISPRSVTGTISKWEENYDFDGFRWAGNRVQAAWECYDTLSGWLAEEESEL